MATEIIGYADNSFENLAVVAVVVAIIGGVVILRWWNRQRNTRGSWVNLRLCGRRGHDFELFGFQTDSAHFTIPGKCSRCEALSPEFIEFREQEAARMRSKTTRQAAQPAAIPFETLLAAARSAAKHANFTLPDQVPGVKNIVSRIDTGDWNRLFVAAVFGLVSVEVIGDGIPVGKDLRKAVWTQAQATLDGWDSIAFTHINQFVHYLNYVANHDSSEWPGCIGYWLWCQLCPNESRAAELRKNADGVHCVKATGEMILACSAAALSGIRSRAQVDASGDEARRNKFRASLN
jgi:hypothetical protein